jgi:hypothetical protein
MHTVWTRANTVLTFFATVLSVLCVLVTVTDLFHQSDPPITVELKEVSSSTASCCRRSQQQLSSAIDLKQQRLMVVDPSILL